MLTRIAVFVSGGGTNLQALIDAAKAGKIRSGEFCLVVSSNPNAYALTRAAQAGIPACTVDPKSCASQAEYEDKLLEVLRTSRIDMIVLAGYLKILSPEFVARYPNAILNVHPALIPSFCGKGYYGLKVHACALERGVKLTGATVHFVNGEADGGPILYQKAVPVRPGDTPEILQRRVMEKAEWVLLPRAVEKVARDMAKNKKD